MIDRTLSHYRILEKIGVGGMGVVYRARDERLDRDVALKVLPVGAVADEAARKRFRKEALMLSQLNHPNIATVHDFDTQDGVDFLVMEHVAGQSLAKRLAAGPLPEKEVAALGVQIAEALEEAHARGIVHRDLKPGNIMVTPAGRAKVLDFGLAKLIRGAGVSPADLGGFGPDCHGQDGCAIAGTTEDLLTRPGAAVGTLAYMSPEQLRGEEIDARTDLFGLGAVLYETATGRQAFSGITPAIIHDVILNRPPRPPRELNSKVSPALEFVILKALEKDPEHRYQSAKEMGVDLRRLAAPSTTSTAAAPIRVSWRIVAPVAIALAGLAVLAAWFALGRWRDQLPNQVGQPRMESLAVLPLENLSHDSEQEFFADGMTDELITDLAQISALRVISRTSVIQYKGVKKPLPEIAKELHVDGVIEGTVLRSGDRVRITAQLIRGATDKHLWAQSYEGDLSDILGLQGRVAQAIASEIRIKLTEQEHARLASARPVDPAAYEDYLKGRFFWNMRTEDGLNKGIEYFRKVLEKDPNYALAYAGLAASYDTLGYYAVRPPREVYPQAKLAAQKALAIDETLAEAHAPLAHAIMLYDWDRTTAEREFQRAIELNPNNADARHWYSHLLLDQGRLDESLVQSMKALEIDPLSKVMNVHLAEHYIDARQYDRALEQLRKTLELDPTFAYAHGLLGLLYEEEKLYPQAIAEFQGVSQPADVAYVQALSGNRKEALKILGQVIELSKHRYVPASKIAVIYAALGERDRAFEWLEKALAERSAGPGIVHNPRFEPLRSDPRFQALLRRYGFPPS